MPPPHLLSRLKSIHQRISWPGVRFARFRADLFNLSSLVLPHHRVIALDKKYLTIMRPDQIIYRTSSDQGPEP
jgi:hypothetical protein